MQALFSISKHPTLIEHERTAIIDVEMDIGEAVPIEEEGATGLRSCSYLLSCMKAAIMLAETLPAIKWSVIDTIRLMTA